MQFFSMKFSNSFPGHTSPFLPQNFCNSMDISVILGNDGVHNSDVYLLLDHMLPVCRTVIIWQPFWSLGSDLTPFLITIS